MRYVSILLLCALPACQSAFQKAQDNTQGFAAGGDFKGEGESFFGTRYAYVEGDFTGTVGAYWEGAALWTFPVNGAVSQGWELFWNAETKKPDIRKVTVEVAKAGIARALPAVP